MKYYIIAGEPSGDLHAANLIKELKKIDDAAIIRGFGGDKMEAAGAEIVRHYRELAFMGFWEVAVNIRTILKHLSFCKKDILQFQPDAVILVDYPGFNFRIASFLKKKKFKVCYYISPQIWAWHVSRVKQVKKLVDRMIIILPFEKEFYEKWKLKVDFVGHPLLDELKDLKLNENFIDENNLEHKRIIAVLPGSRKQEIVRMLPVMLEMVHHFPGYQFVVAGLNHLGENFYRPFIHHPNVKLVMDQTYDVLNNSYAALVTSGTATLETALFDVPQVVCYKGGKLSYYIGKMLIKVDFIAMVNLIAGKKVVDELIQNDFHVENLKRSLLKILDSKERNKIFAEYKIVGQKLGEAGASKKAAEIIFEATKK